MTTNQIKQTQTREQAEQTKAGIKNTEIAANN
jgi:hypothetical protein